MIVQLFDVCNDYSHESALDPMNLAPIAFYYTEETLYDKVALCKRFAQGVTVWRERNGILWGCNKHEELTHCIKFREAL